MNPKFHRHLGDVASIVVTIASLLLWNWAADHLPMWGSALILVCILAGDWVVARLIRGRREASEARAAEAGGSS